MFMITFWSHSCGWGPIWLFLTKLCFIGSNDNSVGIGSSLQKVARQRYSSSQYWATKVTGYSKQIYPWPIHTWSAWPWLTCDLIEKGLPFDLSLKASLKECSGLGPRPNGLGSVCRTDMIYTITLVLKS